MCIHVSVYGGRTVLTSILCLSDSLSFFHVGDTSVLLIWRYKSCFGTTLFSHLWRKGGNMSKLVAERCVSVQAKVSHYTTCLKCCAVQIQCRKHLCTRQCIWCSCRDQGRLYKSTLPQAYMPGLISQCSWCPYGFVFDAYVS